MKKAKKYEIIMNKIPFSCLGESDCGMNGRRGRWRNWGRRG